MCITLNVHRLAFMLQRSKLCHHIIFISAIALTFPLSSLAAEIFISGSKQAPEISINGELMPGDGDKFSLVVNSLSSARVSLNSEGGNLFSGLQIGTIIRNKSFSTIVHPRNLCASSCGLIWLAGSPRYFNDESKIGFHSAYQIVNGEALESGVGNALVGAYLSRLAVTDKAIIFFTLAGPDEINWLTTDVANELAIDYVNLTNGRSFSPQTKKSNPFGKTLRVNSDTERLALQTVNDYFNFMMRDQQSARYFLQSKLTNEVIVDNQFRTKLQVIRARLEDFFRLKSRAIEINSESIRIYCENSRSCEVSGTFSWAGFSNFYEEGNGNFRFDIDLKNSNPLIFGDTVYLE